MKKRRKKKMSSFEKIKFPNTHCPQRAQCMNSKTRWMICKLRKEYISSCIEKERLQNQKIKGKTK